MSRVTIRIDFDGGRNIGHGKIRLLELIAEHGSISRAAKQMDMSYRRAWMLADEMNTMFKEPVLETQHGGSGGGHARLTDFGRTIVDRYREIEAHNKSTFAKLLNSLERDLKGKGAQARSGSQ